MHHFIKLCALLTASLVSLVHAQEEPAVKARLMFAVWNDGYNLQDIMESNPDVGGVPLFYVSESGVQEASAGYGRFSSAVNYRGGLVMPVYTQKPVLDAPLPAPAFTVKLQEGSPTVAVLMFPGKIPGEYRTVQMDLGEDRFEPGTLRLQNLFPSPLYIKVGEKKFVLKPFASEVVRLDVAEDSRGLDLMVVVRDGDTQRIRPLIKRYVRVNPDERLAAFILPHPKKVNAAELRLMPL